MIYKDTLELFDELVATGVSQDQARIQAKQLGGIGNILERIEKDLFWMRIVGGGMIIACFGVMFK